MHRTAGAEPGGRGGPPHESFHGECLTPSSALPLQPGSMTGKGGRRRAVTQTVIREALNIKSLIVMPLEIDNKLAKDAILRLDDTSM